MVTIWSPSPWVEERRESISFALEVFPIRTGHEPARHLLTARRLAGSLSFDAFYFGDHPTWALDCWVHIAALAVTTSRIRLGLIANCVYYRHPVQTARFAADLDNLSDGRLILGVGSAGNPVVSPTSGNPSPHVGTAGSAGGSGCHHPRGLERGAVHL